MSAHMTAARVDRYGPPSTITIVAAPIPEPRPGEALIRVAAAAVTSGDARLRAGRFPRGFGVPARLGIGILGPRRRIPGAVLSGRIERLGDPSAGSQSGFSVGDEVAGMTGVRLGAHAEFAVLKLTALAPKPSGISHADAAGALFGGSTALHFLRDRAHVQRGQRVLVNGASGSVGSAFVQLAVRAGAKVTAVSSSGNHPLLRRLGAATTIDYRDTPLAELTEQFDVVFDAVGNLGRAGGLRLATADGSVILAVASLAETITARGRVIAGAAPERGKDFATILDLVARGEFDPLVEVVGGLDALPAAHARIDTGRKRGNLVVLPDAAAFPDGVA